MLGLQNKSNMAFIKNVREDLMKEMDPVVVKSLREIVVKDMKWEIEMMQNNLECTEKCKLMQQIWKENVGRTAMMVT